MKTFSLNQHRLSLAAGLLLVSMCTSAHAEPLALQKIMKELGNDMQKITDGISREDWGWVEAAALRIADHPRPPMEERKRIISFIGADAGTFKSTDKKTHSTARTLATAAASENGEAAITAFATLQSSCLACHQVFRKRIQQHFYGQP